MTRFTIFMLTYGGRLARLAIHLAGVALDPDGTEGDALREIISRLTAALQTKTTAASTEVLAVGGANVTALTSPYSDDQDKFRAVWKSAEGTTVRYSLPSPTDIFLADHETADQGNAGVISYVAAASALFVSPAGGALTFRRGLRARTQKGGRA